MPDPFVPDFSDLVDAVHAQQDNVPQAPDYGINKNYQDVINTRQQTADLFRNSLSGKGSPFSDLEKTVNSMQGDTNSYKPVVFDPVAENLDRYKGSKYNSELGFIPGENNEERYGRAQSTWDKMSNAIVGGAKIAGYQFWDQLKGWGRMADSIFSSDMSKIYDQNDLADVNNKLQSIFNSNPIFMTKHDQDSVFTISNFANLVQQTGFTIGAMSEIVAEEGLMAVLAPFTVGASEGVELARVGRIAEDIGRVSKSVEQLAEVTQDANKLRKTFAKLADFTPAKETIETLAEGRRVGEGAGEFARRGFGSFYRDLREANAAFTEARSEASSTYNQQKQYLTNELYASGKPVTGDALAEIEKVARESAHANFWTNAAVIGISNRLEFDNVFRGFKGASKYLESIGPITDDAAGFFQKGMNIRTLKAGLRTAPLAYFKNNLVEALQENVQNVTDQAIRSYYKARYDNPGTESFGPALSQAIHDQFTTQGAQTFIGGFLTGALASPISGAAKFAYERLATDSKQRQEQRNQVQATIAKLNYFFTGENAKNMTVQASLGAAMGESIKNGNQKEFYDLKNAAIQEFARTAIQTGKVDALFDRLDSLAKNLTPEEFQKAFGIEATVDNKRKATDYIHDLRQRVGDIESVKEQMDIKFQNPFVASKAQSPEEYADTILKHHAFEEAKWHYLYMKDAHDQTLVRQASILQNISKELHNVDYSALFTLTDKARMKEEINLSRQEASIMTDGREKKQKLKTADLLEALLPSLEQGKLHEKTFYDYINHVQDINQRLPVDKLTLSDNLKRFNDFYALKEDQSKLFDNINRLVAPHSFSAFAQRHFMWQGIQAHMAEVRSQMKDFTDDDLNDVRGKYPDHDIKIDTEGNLNITPKEGAAEDSQKTADILDEITKKVQEKNAPVEPTPTATTTPTDEDKKKADLEAKQVDAKKRITDRLAQIYQDLTDKGTIDEQDQDFLERPDVVEVGKNNSDYLRIQQALSQLEVTTPTSPGANQEDSDKEIKDALTALSGKAAESVPYIEEPRVATKPADNQVSTISKEVGTNAKRNAKGDIVLQEPLAYVKGVLIRLFATNKSQFANYEFVITRDNPEWYKHTESMDQATLDQLKPYEKGPYKYFQNPTAEPGAVLLIRNKNTGEPLYINPYRPGIIADKTSGLLATFSLDYLNMGMDKTSVLEAIQKKGEITLDAEQVIASKGVIDPNKNTRTLKEFQEGASTEGWTLQVAKGEAGTTFDPESNLRTGGIYLIKPGLNPIKLLPQLLSLLTINGQKVDFTSILNGSYTAEQVTKVQDFLQTFIYNGRTSSGDHSEITSIGIISDPANKDLFKVKLGRLTSDAVDENTYTNTGASSEAILADLLSNKRINIWEKTDSDIAVPVVKDGKLERFDTVSYRDILDDNLLTNKVRYVTPDGQTAITSVNNYFTLPGVAEQLKAQPKEVVKPDTLQNDKVADIERKRKEELAELQKQYPKNYSEVHDYQQKALEIRNKYNAELTALNTKEEPIKDRKAKLEELKKKGKQTDSEDFDALTKEKNVTEELARRLITNQELQFIKDRFGDHVLNHMNYAVNSKYWGYWRDGVITLFHDAKEGVGYHEAWHHFSQMFLTVQDKLDLYSNTTKNHPELKNFKEVEEYLADSFRNFAESNGTVLPRSEVQKGIFQRIWDFLKHLFSGKKELKDYYNDLYQGKLYGYTPSINNALWGTLNYGFVKNGIEIFDAKELNHATGLFNTLLGRAFSKEGEGTLKDSGITLSTLLGLKTNPAKLDRAVKRVYDSLLDEFTSFNEEQGKDNPNLAASQILDKMVDNYDDFFKYAIGKLQIDAANIDKEEDYSNASTASSVEDIKDDHETEQLKDETLQDGEAKEAEETQYSDKVVPIADKGLLATLSKFMRNLVLTTPRAEVGVDDKGQMKITEYRNEYGFPEPCDPYKVINILGEELAGTFNDTELLDRLLKDKRLLQRVPELQFIRQSLPNFQEQAGKPFATQAIMALARDFNRVYTGVYSLIELEPDSNGGRRFAFIEQTKNTETKIKREWQDSFLSNKEDTLIDPDNNRQYLAPGFVDKHKDLITYDKGDINGTIARRTAFLERLGLNFSRRTQNTPEFRSMLSSAAFNYFTQAITQRQNVGQFLENPVKDLMSAFWYDNKGKQERLPAEGRMLTNLLRFESQFSDRIPSNMYKTAKGTNKYALMLPNEFNIIGHHLRSAKSIADIAKVPELSNLFDKENYYARNSLVLNSVFNSQGINVGNFEFGDYNSAVIRAYDKRIEKQTTELGGREKLIMDLNALLSHGTIDIMRTGSSETSYFYRLPQYRHNYTFTRADGSKETNTFTTKQLPFPAELFNEGVPTARYNQLLRGYFGTLLIDELTMMNHSKIKDSDAFSARIKEFGVFRDIFSPEGKEQLKQWTKGKSPEQIEQIVYKNLDRIMDDVNDYLDDSTQKFVQYAKEWGIEEKTGQSPQELGSELRQLGMKWNDIAKLFVLNNFVLNTEFTRIYSGATQFYTDYHKRAKGIISTGNTANSGENVKAYLEATHEQTLTASLGKAFNPNINEFKKNTFEDDKGGLSKDTKDLWYLAAKAMNWTKKQMKQLIDRYEKDEDDEKPKINDGQAWSTLDFYRKIRIMQGNWDMAKDEKQFLKEAAIFKLDNHLYKSDTEKQDLEKVASDPQTYSTFPVIKLQYNGPLKTAGIKLPVLDKFSVWPLIPSVHRGEGVEGHKPVLTDMHKWMLNSGHDYVTAKSGTKNFTTDPLKFWNDNRSREKFNVKLSTEEPGMTAHSMFLKEQIKTNGDVKPTSTWGTQLRSLFLSNAFNMGQSTEKMEKLFNNYIGDMESIIEIERKQLFKRFGMTEDENGGVSISNVKDFVDTLQKQVEVRNLNENIKRSIGYDEKTGKFTLPLEINTNRQAIVDLVGGMIFKKIVAIKSNGDMLIQVASTGTRRMVNGKLEDELPFYTPRFDKDGHFVSVNPAGAKVAFNSHFYPLLNLFHQDGKKIGTLERLNESLRDKDWIGENHREITLVGYRIPTQEPNSMEVLHIKEFLPESFGSCIIVPKEIVTKAGSDFDVDKLSIFRPNYGADGKVLYDDKSELQQQARELEAEVNAWRKLKGDKFTDSGTTQQFLDKIFGSSYDLEDAQQELSDMRERFYEIDRKKKAILANKAVDAYIASLTSPENFHQLIRPNSTDTIEPIAMEMGKKLGLRGFGSDKLESYKGTKILEYISNHVKFLQNIQGRNDIGLWALVNKMNQNLQVAGTSMNEEFRNYFKDFSKNQMIFTTFKTTPWLLTSKERESLGKGVPLGSNTDITGRVKQQIISELMNATLDIEKNPFYVGLGLNNYNKGVAALLLLQGVPIERIIAFVNQPVLRHYYDLINKQPYLPAFEGGPTVMSTNIHAVKLLGVNNRKQLEAKIAQIQDGKWHSASLNYDEIFSADRMNKFLKLKSLFSKDGVLFGDQQIILAHFLAMQRMQKVYRMAQNLATTDTRKYATPISAEASDITRSEVQDTRLLEEDSFKRLLTHSFTSPFNMKKDVKGILAKVMPYGFSKLFIKKAGDFLSSGDLFLSKDDMLKLEKTFSNDYITYIALKNGTYKGINLGEYAKDLIYKGIQPTIGERLLSLQKQAKSDDAMSKLFQFFTLASSLNTNISRSDPRIQNVELVKTMDNSTDLQNELIAEFNKLINFQGNEVPNATFSKEQVGNIQEFFRDLAIAAFGQSGFNKSRLYMTDILPIELMHPILRQALHDFRAKTLGDDQFQGKFIDDYIADFKTNNPSLLGGVSKEEWRGKYIIPPTISLEDLQDQVNKVIKDNGNLTEDNNAKNQKPLQEIPTTKVISGGQTGADRLGLVVAKELGIPTGGTAPKGYRTENGPDESLKEFGLKEHSSPEYLPRTELNVMESDGTVIFGNISEPGSKRTLGFTQKHKKPVITNPDGPKLRAWLASNNIKTLNVAGNRGSKLSDEQRSQFKEILRNGLKGAPKPAVTEVKNQADDETGSSSDNTSAQFAKYLSLTAGLPILEGNIQSDKTTPVAARYSQGKIYINTELLHQKYSEKAWTKPVEQKDGSKASMIREDAFPAYEDFLKFVLLHETAHHYMKRQDETIGSYETRVNNEALQRLRQSGSPESYDQVSFRLPELYLKGPQTQPFETYKQNAIQFMDGLMQVNPEPSAEDMQKLEEQLRCL